MIVGYVASRLEIIYDCNVFITESKEAAGEQFFASSRDLHEAAWLVQFLNDWWDTMDSVTKVGSPHFQFWEDLTKIVPNMHYVMTLTNPEVIEKDPRLWTLSDFKPSKTPSLKNMVLTVDAFVKIFWILMDLEFEELNGKHLNTDIIENLFGLLRAVGLFNTNPNNEQFGGNLKALILTGTFAAKIKGSNSIAQGTSRSYFTAETFRLVQCDAVKMAEEDDALPTESNVALLTSVGGSFRVATIRQDSIKAMFGSDVCIICSQTFLHENFPSLIDELEKALLARTFVSYKKLSIVDDLQDLCLQVLHLPWHQCSEHTENTLKHHIASTAVNRFLFSWCSKQNEELGKQSTAPQQVPELPTDGNDVPENREQLPLVRHSKRSTVVQGYGKPNKARKTIVRSEVSRAKCIIM